VDRIKKRDIEEIIRKKEKQGRVSRKTKKDKK